MERRVVNIVRPLVKNATAQQISHAWRITDGRIIEQWHVDWMWVIQPQDVSTAWARFLHLSYTMACISELALHTGWSGLVVCLWHSL